MQPILILLVLIFTVPFSPHCVEAEDLLNGRVLKLLDKPGVEKDGAVVSFANEPDIAGPLPDGVCPAESEVTILTDTGVVSSTLDCALWSSNGSGTVRKYQDRDATSGIQKITLKETARGGKLVIKAKGASYGAGGIAGPISFAQTQLTVDGTSYCGRWSIDLGSVEKKNEDGKVLFKGPSGPCKACNCRVGEVCLFGRCTTGGSVCTAQSDCGAGEYCELTLGGAGTPVGSVCTQALLEGACIPQPPACEGLPEDPPDCADTCEFMLPSIDPMVTVKRWQWGYDPAPSEETDKPDVWSTPVVARMYDANCDGVVNEADPPNLVFVSANSQATTCAASGACTEGVLRMLDGSTGEEIWTLDAAQGMSAGFAGASVAVGDVDVDGFLEIVALTGEGNVAVIEADGTVLAVSTQTVDTAPLTRFGWGGALSIGDMDADGEPEIAFGRNVFTVSAGQVQHVFTGTYGRGSSTADYPMSLFADLNSDGDQELLAGNTAYESDGSVLWSSLVVPDGFTAVADLDGVVGPEVVLISGGRVYILNGATGALLIGPVSIVGNGDGGPPIIADFDGDGAPEIGVAMQNFYTMMEANFTTGSIVTLWAEPNHDNVSSVTAATAFDFDGDGAAEVVYADECFFWIFNGTDGEALYTASTQSVTTTGSPVVADIDGDGKAEVAIAHDGANPTTWHCAHHTTGNDGYPAWSPPAAAAAYRGVTVLEDYTNAWASARTLYNQQSYNVTNICDGVDGACVAGTAYGEIPAAPLDNWNLFWLNNYRTSSTDADPNDAPDPALWLSMDCVDPPVAHIQLRNAGTVGLVPNVEVELFLPGPPEVILDTVYSTRQLGPGEIEVFDVTVSGGLATSADIFEARIVNGQPGVPDFVECRTANNSTGPVTCD